MLVVTSSMGQLAIEGIKAEDLTGNRGNWIELEASKVVRVMEQSTRNPDGTIGLNIALAPMINEIGEERTIHININSITVAFEPNEELKKAVVDVLEGKDINSQDDNRILKPDMDLWKGPGTAGRGRM